MQGGWVWAGLATVGLMVLVVRRWTKTGKPPDTSLRCNNCPKLVERNRQLIVLAVALGIAEVVTLGAWGVSQAPH